MSDKPRFTICATKTFRTPFTVNVYNDYSFGVKWFGIVAFKSDTVIYRIRVIPKKSVDNIR